MGQGTCHSPLSMGKNRATLISKVLPEGCRPWVIHSLEIKLVSTNQPSCG